MSEGTIVPQIRRSGPCPCGSGRKYKNCCEESDRRAAQALGLYNLGTALSDAGRYDEALASLEAARDLAPRNPHVLNNLGLALQELGRLEDAAASFRAALALAPDFAEAHANLHALLVASDPAAAAECLQRALALRPDDSALRFLLGVLLTRRGDARGASHLDAVAAGNALDRARVDAWKYIASAAPQARIVGTRAETFRLALAAAKLEGLVLEFGVHFGASLRLIAGLAGQPVHGFDSFRGLPEDWHGEPRGSYSTDGALPEMPANVALHAGWFAEALPGFAAAHGGKLRLLHVDCDLYSSTRTVLTGLADRVAPGTVMVFDEYLAHEHWREDEFRAFQEEAAQRGWRYEYLCYSLYTKQAALRIT